MTPFQSLESRTLFSGNVSVKITDSQVRFVGDADSNALVVNYSGPENQLVVTGANGTTIDGKSSRIYSARDNIAVGLGAGDDVVTLQRLSGGFNVGVDLGAGDDAVYFKRSSILAADFFGGTGNDRLDITDSTVSRRLRVFAGEQDDITALRAVRARQGLEITDTAGNTVVAMQQVSASKTSWFSGSGRRDDLRFIDSDFAAFSAKLKDGNDRAYVRGTTFAQQSPIDGGGGSNDIDREVTVAVDFTSGLQGWVPDIVAGDVVFPGQSFDAVAAQQGFEFIHAAPLVDVGMSGTTVSAVDQSPGDLSNGGEALYITKAVGLAEGLQSGQQYRVSADYTVVTRGDENGFFFGVTPAQPAGADDGNGNFIWNVRRTGTDPDVVSESSDASGGNPKVQHQRRDLASGFVEHRISNPAQTITLASDGTAWPVLGMTFGGPTGSTPYQTYLLKASIRLTPVS